MSVIQRRQELEQLRADLYLASHLGSVDEVEEMEAYLDQAFTQLELGQAVSNLHILEDYLQSWRARAPQVPDYYAQMADYEEVSGRLYEVACRHEQEEPLSSALLLMDEARQDIETGRGFLKRDDMEDLIQIYS